MVLPHIYQFIASNKDMPLPLKLFEVQDIVLIDEKRGYFINAAKTLKKVPNNSFINQFSKIFLFDDAFNFLDTKCRNERHLGAIFYRFFD